MSELKVPRGRDFSVQPAAGWDAVTVLTIGMVLTCAIPSYLSISALGQLGRPGVVWFLGAVLWWEWSQLQRPIPRVIWPQPARRWLALFLGVVLVSYAVNNLAGLPADEARTADSGVLKALSWAGLFLIAHDGIVDRDRLLVLMRRVALIGTLMSALGLLQFWTGQSFVSSLYLPGFAVGEGFDNIQDRSGFLRAAGTASHPLEYGVVLCMSLPLAITLALSEEKGRNVLRWLSVGLIGCASVLSVSRSALIGTATALIILMPGWSRSARRRALVIVAAGVLAVYFLVPGMVGTVRGMFAGIAGDSSTQSRTNGYDSAFELASRNLLVGRGLGTFLPSYRILDNEYLLLLIELGALGLILFAVLVASGIYCVIRTLRLSTDPLVRQLSFALMASLTAGGVMFAFFDALSFPMAAAFMFLILGMSGALWRIARNESLQTTASAYIPEAPVNRPEGRRRHASERGIRVAGNPWRRHPN
ncbi:O-antigen ligase family protein [Pseudarthrobacter sulfonivorans]|uniref:O-antigen ligase family protein n=1 Tax=Pseudarthrobacter sulfonivorans TaxID=121292 RepID=UPI00210494CB|nr:O-antigen ligase family protein [Pseudarthrobacter sulfonivorans]